MIRNIVLWIGAVCLAGSAFFFSGKTQHYLLVSLLLFWPFLDPAWRFPTLPSRKLNRAVWVALLAVAGILLLWQPKQLPFAISTLFFAALPEEWFFRAYFMTQLEQRLKITTYRPFIANCITALLFSLLHGLTQNWMLAMLVFFPSLAYGWLYQRTKDIVFIVLAHVLSNLIFIMFLKNQLAHWL